MGLPHGLPIEGVVLVDHLRGIDREARKLKAIGKAWETVFDEIRRAARAASQLVTPTNPATA